MQGEGHVKVKAEMGVKLLQAKEHQGWPAHHQRGEAWDRLFFVALRRKQPPTTFLLDF